jgi:hypothetical protein
MAVQAPLDRELNATLAYLIGQGFIASGLGCEISLKANKHANGAWYEGTCFFRDLNGGDLPDRTLRLVALAGPLAAKMHVDGYTDPDDLLDWLHDSKHGALPHIAECTLDDAEYVVGKLRSNWQRVTQEIRSMAPFVANNSHYLH